MLKSHIDAVEKSILAQSSIAANAGHTLHRGTPREVFIKEFLENHLAENIAIGTGEVIDSNSQPRQSRNQIDITLYKRNYPKLSLSTGVNAFLAESVVSTIEIKSLLTEVELEKAMNAAVNTKLLTLNNVTSFSTGFHPPSILSFVVAYDGPATMNTVKGWVDRIVQKNNIALPNLPSDDSRFNVAGPTIDGIFILGKGFLIFENSPASFLNNQIRVSNPNIHWSWCDNSNGNLLMLFLLLTIGCSGVKASWLNPFPYLSNFQVNGLRVGP